MAPEKVRETVYYCAPYIGLGKVEAVASFNEVLTAQGIKLSLGGGRTVTEESRLAALTVCLPYIGFPRTLNALACVNEVLPEAA